MTSSDQNSSTALVTGASRGFGRAIASALHAQGAKVVAVARNAKLLDSLHSELGDSLITAVADVTDPVVAGTLIEQHRPDTLVLNAGAQPLSRRFTSTRGRPSAATGQSTCATPSTGSASRCCSRLAPGARSS